MDLQYGIAVTNKFALFIDEDEDPLEVLKLKEEELKNSKKDDKTKKTKSAKKSAPIESKPKQPEQQPVKREDKPNQQVRTERGGGRVGRGRELRENDGSRPPRRQGPRDSRDGFKGDENVPPEFRDRGDGSNRRERGEGGFERGRGRGGGRGRSAGRGGPRGPRPESGRGGGFGGSGERRREFDRHSGTDKTGVKPVDKRDGGGAHNWGSYKDDVEEQAAAPVQADESGEWAAAPVEQPENTELNESGEAAAPKEDDEAKVMTLDEWKALQEQKRMKATFNIRKAGEGVDNAQWKKGIAYTKKKEDSDEEESDEEEEDDRHGHRKQIVTDIRITFADNPRRGGRGGRGGRGRGGSRGESRGGPRGGGRGEFRGERSERPPRGGPRESAPRMDDETDFPKLVKSEA